MYEKGIKLQKGYEVTKRVRNYEKERSCEKGTKLRKMYEATKKVRSGNEIIYERPWL
jgi:hypothetical protein